MPRCMHVPEFPPASENEPTHWNRHRHHGCEHSEGYICLLLSLSLYVCVNNDIMYYVYIIYSLSDGNEPKCDTVGIPYKPVTFRT